MFAFKPTRFIYNTAMRRKCSMRAASRYTYSLFVCTPRPKSLRHLIKYPIETCALAMVKAMYFQRKKAGLSRNEP